MDRKLIKEILKDARHPVDTGTLKKSWKLPEDYLRGHRGPKWEIYIENTATIGQQFKARTGKELYSAGRYTFKGRKGLTGRKHTRYLKFVDKRTHFYSKKLKLMRQTIGDHFKQYVAYKHQFPYKPWAKSVATNIYDTGLRI